MSHLLAMTSLTMLNLIYKAKAKNATSALAIEMEMEMEKLFFLLSKESERAVFACVFRFFPFFHIPLWFSRFMLFLNVTELLLV